MLLLGCWHAQRASDVVRKLLYGDIDLGIVGYDMLTEIGNQDPGELSCSVHIPVGSAGAGLALVQELGTTELGTTTPVG